MTTTKADWKRIATELGERMHYHAFCTEHSLEIEDPRNCPFCHDRRAYLDYVALMSKDGTPRQVTLMEVFEAQADMVSVDELLERPVDSPRRERPAPEMPKPKRRGRPQVEWGGTSHSECNNFAIQTSEVREEGFYAELWLLSPDARAAYKRLCDRGFVENGWYGAGARAKCKSLARDVAEEMLRG